MVASTPYEAVANANAYTSCTPGMCLQYVRTWLEITSLYASASKAWDGAKNKHPKVVNAPKGAPVFWKGGSQGYGHIALSIGGGKCRSTDIPSGGRIATVDISWITRYWGQEYMGWTEDLNGVSIPYLSGAQGSEWAKGDVYVEKLHYGQLDSDSVSRLRFRLTNHAMIPQGRQPGLGAGYGVRTVSSVMFWQRNVAPKVAGPKDGKYLSNQQARVLFGPNYTVHPK